MIGFLNRRARRIGNLRNTARAANKDEGVNVVKRQIVSLLGAGQCHIDLGHGSIEKRLEHRLEVGRGEAVVDLVDLGSGNLQKEVLPLILVTEVNLHLLGRERQAADQPGIAAEVLAELGFHPGQHPVDDLAIDITAAEVGVSSGTEDLDSLVLHDPDHRDVKRAAAEIEDNEGLWFTPVKSIRHGRGRRLIDYEAGIELGNPGRLACGIFLGFFETCGYGDHRVVDRLSDHLLRTGLQFLEDVRRNDLRVELDTRPVHHRLATVVMFTHEPFHFVNDPVRIAPSFSLAALPTLTRPSGAT